MYSRKHIGRRILERLSVEPLMEPTISGTFNGTNHTPKKKKEKKKQGSSYKLLRSNLI